MKKMNKIALLIIATVALVMASCASSEGKSGPTNMPDWFLKQPKDTNVYGVGTAKNSDISTAKLMAENAARTDLSFRISTAVRAVQSTSTSIDNKTFNQAVEQISQTTLNGTEVVEVKSYDSEGGYTLYALCSYPRAKLDAALKQASKNVPELANIDAIHEQLDKVTK